MLFLLETINTKRKILTFRSTLSCNATSNCLKYSLSIISNEFRSHFHSFSFLAPSSIFNGKNDTTTCATRLSSKATTLIARSVKIKHGSTENEAYRLVAAFLMCYPVKNWHKVRQIHGRASEFLFFFFLLESIPIVGQ